MTALRRTLLWSLFAFIAFSILNPNPFGNNPDIVWDESYFLTSSLSAIQNHTLPGWDFPASGTYYGGPQTYLDTLIMVPVVGAVFAHSHFSVTQSKLWIASHTGDLLHILRLVNGGAALLAILLLYLYFKKREIPRELGLTLTFFLFLLLSNVLVVEFLHTAKVWGFYIIFVSVVSAFFIAQEYYLSRLSASLISTERYTALLVWSGVLVFFQSYVGVFSIALLTLYALVLGHITVRDIWNHVKRYWYLIVIFSLTQISFLYQAYTIRSTFSGVATKTAEGSIDWFTRLVKPVIFALESQPLVVLYALGVLVMLFFAVFNRSFFDGHRKLTLTAIAIAHPFLTYLIFHVGIGFDILPRYAILLTLACSFSAAILVSEFGTKATLAALAASGALFFVVNVHAITLYWHPSSETVLLQTILQKYNAADTLFIIDHSARRLTLPVNADSLLLLNQKRQDMGRFAFMLQHRDALPASTFMPLTVTAYAPEEESQYLAQFATSTYSIWMVRRSCADRCADREAGAGTCFEINMNACGIEPQEVNTLRIFLFAQQLGYSYIVRKVH